MNAMKVMNFKSISVAGVRELWDFLVNVMNVTIVSRMFDEFEIIHLDDLEGGRRSEWIVGLLVKVSWMSWISNPSGSGGRSEWIVGLLVKVLVLCRFNECHESVMNVGWILNDPSWWFSGRSEWIVGLLVNVMNVWYTLMNSKSILVGRVSELWACRWKCWWCLSF